MATQKLWQSVRAMGCLLLVLAGLSAVQAAQIIPGVDVVIRKPGQTSLTFIDPAIPAGELDQLNDTEIPRPASVAISTTRSNTKGGLLVGGGTPPLDQGNGDWLVDSFFDVFYEIEFDFGGGNIVPFVGTGQGHMVGTGVTNSDWDGDGDVDLDDALLTAVNGPIHQFDVAVDAFDVTDPGNNIFLRESPSLESSAQFLRRDRPDGKFVIAGFFDVWIEMSLDGGGSWLPASSSLQFMTLDIPEPTTGLLLGLALGTWAIKRRR